jgi:glycosyltransferase involved in cell wall biosynthesis
MVKPHPTVSGSIDILKQHSGKFYRPLASDLPVVSIISSFYNAGGCYFEENYQSLINQTFQNFEWIIVDDRSTEPESIALFESLTQRTPKIKTFSHDRNRGLAAGRNTAIAKASGKYLFFADLDDLFDPTYIEKCVLFLETHLEFSFVNSYSIGFQAQEYFWEHGFDKQSQFIHQNWVTCMLLYRKVDFDRLGGFDEKLRFYEDWDRWLKAICNHQKGWTIPEYLNCYRRTKSGLLSSSQKNTDEEHQVKELIQSRYQAFFTENNLDDLSIRRVSPFDLNLQEFKLDIKNPLNRHSTGKSVLCFFPWLEVGGADKFNVDLLTLLANRGYEITIATTIKSEHPWHHHFYQISPDIFHLPNLLDESHWLAFIRYLLESRQIDVVFISNCYVAYYLLPLLRLEFPTIAFVDYTHIYDPGWRGSGYPRISCQFSQFLDCQIVSSQHLAEFYHQCQPQTNDKLQVCYSNVNTNAWVFSPEGYQQIRSSLGITAEQIVLLFPARIASQKRPLFLVNIIEELATRGLPIMALVLGDGPLLSQMKEKIGRLGLDSFFQILPPVSPAQMQDFYSASDILLLPSEYEGISVSIYEAMSMQLPIVASDVGGQDELLLPGTGFLIPKGKQDAAEVDAYLQVLVPLIENTQFRKQVGYLARQRVCESFSLEIMCDNVEVIFAEAIQSCQTRYSVEVDRHIAEESLILALEYMHKDRLLADVWSEKCNLEREREKLAQEKCTIEQERDELAWKKNELSWQKNAMETSKFWKMRKLWFNFKQKLSLSAPEE